MRIIDVENIRAVGGTGLAMVVVWEHQGSTKREEVFKTDGSATHWCNLEDGQPCSNYVWQFWEAYKARNLLAGKLAYECSPANPEAKP
jgi:hypothetical protein